MEKKVRNQFLIGGLIMLVGIGMYLSGITPGQVTECDPRIAGGGIEDCRDYSAFQRSTIPTIILIVGIAFIIRGILMLRNSSLE
ncbi:MAG: hypothetical protein ATL_04290 [Thaumarchaeota archaeon]|jgi:hypothetical protein|nr:hypothetical protein [Nitrososphaerota archaeon]NSL75886.1 hypothetical protein [Nitrososphaerota archaeon]